MANNDVAEFNLEINDSITVNKIIIEGDRYYLLIGWQPTSFEMYLYTSDGALWKGRFSTNRMNGFSKNLHLSPDSYFKKVYLCLSQRNDDYVYELKSGFFYWKRKLNDTFILEGFLPVETVNANKTAHPDLVEVLVTLNVSLKNKVNELQAKFNMLRTDFQRSLKDTEEFINLKVEMEKSLCDKFLNLVNLKKFKLEKKETEKMESKEETDKVFILHKPSKASN